MSDIEIARKAKKRHIKEIAARFAALIESFRSLDDLELQHELPYHTDLSEVQHE